MTSLAGSGNKIKCYSLEVKNKVIKEPFYKYSFYKYSFYSFMSFYKYTVSTFYNFLLKPSTFVYYLSPIDE